MKRNELIVNRIIYAKRKPTTSEQVREILKLEIETHLRNNPGLYFLKIGEPIKNPDQSKTFRIFFDLKINKLNKHH